MDGLHITLTVEGAGLSCKLPEESLEPDPGDNEGELVPISNDVGLLETATGAVARSGVGPSWL